MRSRPSATLRSGAVAPLGIILLAALLGMVAFAVDTGYVAVVRNESQNAADAAALAGMARLAEQLKAAPIIAGVPTQSAEDLTRACEAAKAVCAQNRIGGVYASLLDIDIDIGFMANPYDHSQSLLDKAGWPERPYNAVLVTVRRDQRHAGGPVKLIFGRFLGTNQVEVAASATAVVAMGNAKPRGNQGDVRGAILPLVYQVDEWNALLSARQAGTTVDANGQTYNFTDNYSVDARSNGPAGVGRGSDGTLEGILYPDRTTSGNFGSISFSKSKVNNSTSVLREMIERGPNHSDWPDLGDILNASPSNPISVNGDPGISAGIESAIREIIGETHILPLYSEVSGTGNNSFYRIVGFVPITIVAVDLHGANKQIVFQPRIASYKASINGSDRLSFSLTPSANPNLLYLGPRALVR